MPIPVPADAADRRRAAGVDSALEERAVETVQEIIRKAQPAEPAAPALAIFDLNNLFGTAELGTPIDAATMPAFGQPVDFPCRITGAYLAEMSVPGPISGSASVTFWVKQRGATAWDATGITVSFTGAVSGSLATETALADALRWLEPGDEVAAQLTSAATVESVTATLRLRRPADGEVVSATAEFTDPDGAAYTDEADAEYFMRRP
jgi:hypothetical protein